jgi:hypothetical protein
MSNHFGTVAFERAKYPAPEYDRQGKLLNPLGFENAWKITNAVGYTHQDEGWGLLKKIGGTQWLGCTIDVLINRRTRQAVDCLGKSEEEGIPVWNPIEYLPDFDLRWVAPTSGAPEPPTPPVPPMPPAPPVNVRQIVSPDGLVTAQLNNDGRLVAYKGGVALWAVIPDAEKKT